jgi:hypothetical protein
MDETPPSSQPPIEPPQGFPPPPDSGIPQWRESPAGYGIQPSLYPMDLGRIFSLTFSIFRFRWRTFAGAVLLLTALPTVLFAGAQALSINLAAWYVDFEFFLLGREPTMPAIFPWQEFAANTVVSLIYGFSVMAAVAAITRVTAETFVGGHPTAISATRDVLRMLPSLFGLVVVLQLAVLAVGVIGGGLAALPIVATGGRITGGPGFFLALVMGVATVAFIVFLTLRWYLAVTVVTLERRGTIGSIRRSWHLVRGSTWRLLGYVLLFLLIIGVIAFVLGLIFAFIIVFALIGRGSSIASLANPYGFDPITTFALTLISGLFNALLLPIVYIAITLLYFDLRSRQGERAPVPGAGDQSLALLAEEQPQPGV